MVDLLAPAPAPNLILTSPNKFKCPDNKLTFFCFSCTSMLLVTQYHERGSLYDYLSRPDTSLTQQIAFKLIESALKGLDHLHKEVHAAGVSNLPSMYTLSHLLF